MKRRCGGSRWRMISAVVLAGCGFVMAAVSAEAQFSSEPEEHIKRLIVKVTAKRSGVEYLGAGIIFAMGPDHLYVMTANHVVRGRGGRREPEEVYIELKWMPDRPIRANLSPHTDSTLDLAVLTVSGLTDLAVNQDRLSFDQLGDPDALQRGDAIYLLGHPVGRTWRINTTAEKFATIAGHLLEFESNLIATGHSGGGLLNRRMELVGMLRSDQAPYGEAVNITTILKKLAEWGYPVRLSMFAVRVSAGAWRTCHVTPEGHARCWGKPREDFDRTIQTQGLQFKALSVGSSHVCGIVSGGVAYCVGNNHHGQLGTGTTGDRYNSPALVHGELILKSVSAGAGHTCGVTVGGQAYCWGLGKQGQLGDGRGQDSAVPVLVSGGLAFKSVSAGWLYTVGVTTSGTLYYWGALNDDASGYFGRSSVPLSISERFESISAGLAHACGVSAKGVVHCWGVNQRGELSNGSDRQSSNMPTPVSSNILFRSVSAGMSHTCGIDTAGVAHCWGRNEEGQLGNNTRVDSVVPTVVAGGRTFTSISAGSLHTCGVTTDRSIYCWGANRHEELGAGKAESDTPILVFSAAGRDTAARSTLHAAAAAGSVEMLRTSLEAGAAVNVRDDVQRTPLHVSLEAGNHVLAALLLEHGADPNARIPVDARDFLTVDSPLTIALAHERFDLLRLVLSKGADPNAASPADGSTALHWAAAKAPTDAVAALLEAGANPNALDHYLRTPLHHAVDRGHVAIVAALLEAGADPDAMTFGEDTPLHIAAAAGHEEIAQRLVSAGAHVNYRDRWNRNPLHVAEMKEYYVIVDLLAKRGATLLRRSMDEPTPLYLAARDGDLPRVRALLSANADVHKQVNDRFGDLQPRFHGGGPSARGRTALHTAVIGSHRPVVEALLDAGADPDRWDGSGFSPFHLAVLTARFDLARLLLERGANVNWPLRESGPTPLLNQAAQDGNLRAVALLLEQRAEVNAEDHIGRTALHEACRNNEAETVRLLLSRGADPNPRGSEWTPLASAVSTANREIVALLLDAGAKIDAPANYDRETPLHLALRRDDRMPIAALLVERGANVTVTDERGRTPLDLVALPPEAGSDGLRRLLAARASPRPHALLGVNIQNLNSARAAALGDPQLRGVEVTGIAPDGAARHARIRSGDVITTYDGQPVRTTGGLVLLLMESAPGQRVTLGLFRDGARLTVPVELKSK